MKDQHRYFLRREQHRGRDTVQFVESGSCQFAVWLRSPAAALSFERVLSLPT